MRSANRWLIPVLALLIGGLCCPLLGARQPGDAAPSTDLVAEFPIFNDGDVLLIPVTIDGKERTFLFDTGFSLTTFDKRLKSSFVLARDPAERAVQVPGAGEMENAVAPEFSIAGLPALRSHPIWVGDLSQLRQSYGHNIAGIIGSDVLRGLVLRIDADAARLQILRAAPSSETKPISLGWKESGVPVMAVSLAPGVDAELVLDTGLYSLDVSLTVGSRLYKNLEARGSLKTLYATPFGTVGGVSDAQVGVLEKITYGRGLETRGMRVTEHNEGLQLLGLSFLLQFNATLDLKNDRLLLEPRKDNTAAALTATGSGVSVIRGKGASIVQGVRAGSRAATAGLRPQDTIELVEGKQVSSMRVHALRLLIETEGEELSLQVRAPEGPPRQVVLSRKDVP